MLKDLDRTAILAEQATQMATVFMGIVLIAL
jgi:hypothetical protein